MEAASADARDRLSDSSRNMGHAPSASIRGGADGHWLLDQISITWNVP